MWVNTRQINQYCYLVENNHRSCSWRNISTLRCFLKGLGLKNMYYSGITIWKCFMYKWSHIPNIFLGLFFYTMQFLDFYHWFSNRGWSHYNVKWASYCDVQYLLLQLLKLDGDPRIELETSQILWYINKPPMPVTIRLGSDHEMKYEQIELKC